MSPATLLARLVPFAAGLPYSTRLLLSKLSAAIPRGKTPTREGLDALEAAYVETVTPALGREEQLRGAVDRRLLRLVGDAHVERLRAQRQAARERAERRAAAKAREAALRPAPVPPAVLGGWFAVPPETQPCSCGLAVQAECSPHLHAARMNLTRRPR